MNAAFFLTPKSQTTFLETDDTFRQGLEKMRHHGYTAIPVLNKEGGYAGTLSEGDLLWSIIDIGGASMQDCEKLKISDILTRTRNRNPSVNITAKTDELLERLLSQNFVPVTDDRGAFMGIVTRHSMLDYLREKADRK